MKNILVALNPVRDFFYNKQNRSKEVVMDNNGLKRLSHKITIQKYALWRLHRSQQQSWEDRMLVGLELSYRPSGLHRLAELFP